MKTDIIYGLADVSLYLSDIGKHDFMRTVEVACAEITQLRNKVESLEKKVEDQEERIAIMTEGKLTLDDFHDFLWDNYFVLKICEESMAFLNKWILAYKEHVKVEHKLPEDGDPE